MAILNINNYSKIARGTGGLTAPSVPKIKKSTLLDPTKYVPTKRITYTPTTPTTAPEVPKYALQGAMAASQSIATKSQKSDTKGNGFLNKLFPSEEQRIAEGKALSALAPKSTGDAFKEVGPALLDGMDTFNRKILGSDFVDSTGGRSNAIGNFIFSLANIGVGVYTAAQIIPGILGQINLAINAIKNAGSAAHWDGNAWVVNGSGRVVGSTPVSDEVATEIRNAIPQIGESGASALAKIASNPEQLDEMSKALSVLSQPKNQAAIANMVQKIASSQPPVTQTALPSPAIVSSDDSWKGKVYDGLPAERYIQTTKTKNLVNYTNPTYIKALNIPNGFVDAAKTELAKRVAGESPIVIARREGSLTPVSAGNGKFYVFRQTTPSELQSIISGNDSGNYWTTEPQYYLPKNGQITLVSTSDLKGNVQTLGDTNHFQERTTHNIGEIVDVIDRYGYTIPNSLPVASPQVQEAGASSILPKEVAKSVPKSFALIPTSQAKDIIENGTYGIFSTYTGDTTEEANKAKALAYSQETGRDTLESQYGGREQSHIVPVDEVKALAKKYHQQTYLVVKGHHYEMFSTETGKKVMEGDKISFDNSLPDFYTEVQTADSPIRFSMDLHDVSGNLTEADIAAHQTEANVLLASAENQGISLPSMSAGTTSSQGAKDVAIGNFAKAINRNINVAGTHRNLDLSGFHWGYREFQVSDGSRIIAPDGIDTIGAATALTNAYVNKPDSIKIGAIRYDLEANSGAQWNHEHAGLSATGRHAKVIQNELDRGDVVVRLIVSSTGSAPTLKALKEANIVELWTAFKHNENFIDLVKERMPTFWDNHPDFTPTGIVDGKSITKDERLFLTQLANDFSSDFNKARAGRVSGVAVIARNGIIDIQRTSWNEFDKHVLGHYPTVIAGVYYEIRDTALMPLWGDIIAAETPISGFKPNTYKAPFVEAVHLNIANPEIKKLIGNVYDSVQEFNRQVGLSSNTPISGTWSNAANPPQPETNGTIDLSKYIEDVPTEQVVSAINGALRPGFINITSVAHLANTPARTFSNLLNNDPLKIGLDKLGFYDLLYGKETNAELQLGQGNPSVWNFGFVPATVKSVMLWGELFTAPTRLTFKDITVEADLQRDELIGFDRAVSKLSKDEFVQMLWDIKRGGSGMLPTQGATSRTKTQELADRFIAISKRAQNNLIAAGLDPQIFARLQGHYLPAPSDELGQEILPTIDEKMTVKPSLGFIEKQVLPQETIIGMASQDETWQDYRDYMVSRMAAEIRAGEKGRFFNAIAADPNTHAIMPNSIDYNTGKRVTIPKDYIVFSLGGEKKSFALDGYAVPKWVALFINNQFTGKAAMEQMKVIQEILGQWKWNKAIANIPTLIRNIVSQLTFQSLESGLSVFNLDDYIIRPLGALLGLNKADQQELIHLGILNSGLIRDLEGLGWSPQERTLWQSGEDRGLKLGMVYDKFKTARNMVSSVYSFSDNLTKAGAYYAARRNFDPRTARALSSLTTGDYSQRPPVVNYLTRGIYNGHINPFAMVFSSPFAFFKLVVEPQRVGNLIRFHPSLLVAGLLAAAIGIKGLIKKLVRDYNMSEAEATALVNQFENYYWLNGKYVIPTGKNEGIDVTSMIPMLNYITEVKKALVADKKISQIFATANSLITGVNSANFILETLVSFSTGNDLNYFLQYGTIKSIGKTNTEQLLWLLGQMSPTWLSKLLIRKPNGKDFTLDDLIGQYKVTLSEADKLKSWSYIKSDPNISPAEKKRTAAAFFGPNSLEQIAWERTFGK